VADRRVLIVEDDATVASIHRRIVSAHPGFRVSAVAGTAGEAMTVIRRGVPIDLILLDLALPGGDGVSLLRALRGREGADGGPEVIAVTAARDPKVVRTLLQLGVVDYLVKPFTAERLQQALVRYRDRVRTLSAERLGQSEIDKLYAGQEASMLPKGLNPATLEAVRGVLRTAPGEALTSDEVATRASVARVTARRYLEYLTAVRQVEYETHSDGPGRPSKIYRWLQLDA
jgi:response regulator of citrate/malate metabolism